MEIELKFLIDEEFTRDKIFNDKEEADKLLKDLQKYTDKAVSKGLIKKNTADRQKARLTQKVKNMK